MNLRRLKYFVKIVDIGSLTQAAEVLHIAQPALSQQVATLEGEMDQQLLIRTKRGVTPTEAGKILYAHARTILRQCEQAQLAVNNVGHTPQRPCVHRHRTRHGGGVNYAAVAPVGA
ncbi:nitrogen assimilation regulatory protein Nac [Atlantibacter hermannii]|nr:nitrogen assimilation regulatory protein Nac [Atlantibacter hermannii]